MGKPMGNGMPIAGMAARPEVLDPFGTHVRYFNTFGGNSVCIATCPVASRAPAACWCLDSHAARPS
jgi:4-aminobutyrate aminotransferase-like enzyme